MGRKDNLPFEDRGFEVLESILSPKEVQSLLAALNQHKLEPLSGGIRRIEQLVPEIAGLVKAEKITSIAERYLTSKPRLVRAIYFDKSPENNWFVTWHQDRTVSVSERFEAEDWGPWSVKAGAWHVQPPLAVLKSMVAIRLHLDSSTISNGCLKFLPGSHKAGLIKSGDVQQNIKNYNSVYCEAPAGSAIVMRPHIFHSSEKASIAAQRRVLHFEYSDYELPAGIDWAA